MDITAKHAHVGIELRGSRVIGRNDRVPCLVISLSSLETALLNDDAKIANEDVHGLISNLCRLSEKSGWLSRSLASRYTKAYELQAYCDNCESQPCACETTPYIRFEYDLEYSGGNYNRTGVFALIGKELVDLLGAHEAFEFVTGHEPVHIIHYSPDELVTRHNAAFQGED